MPRRGRRPWVVAAGAALVLGGLVAGTLLSLDDDGGGTDSGGAASLSAEGAVACASSIAEGRVAEAGPVDGGKRFRVLLDVEHSYKPADGGDRRLAFTTDEPEAEAYYRVGARMLVLVSSEESEAPASYREGDPPPSEEDDKSAAAKDRLQWGRAWVEKALDAAQGMKCSGKG